MSKANKLFEKLGYSGTDTKDSLGYIKPDGKEFILFIENGKRITIHRDDTEYPAMNMQELQAINKKCQELGWIE